MAAALPHPHSEVVDELHPEPQVAEEEEIVDLHKPDEPPAPAAQPEAKPAEEPAPAPAAEGDDEIPAEWRGKSQKELAKMLRDAQQVIGRQGSELGDFRKKADLLIQASLANLAETRRQAPAAPAAAPAAPAPEEKLDDVEFFRSPQEAIAKAIAASPIIKEIKATLGQAAASQAESRAIAATQRFNAAHPDAAEIMADPEFRTWVQASRVRTQLLQRAHSAYDFDAGDEVFGTWKALKGVKPGGAAPSGTSAAAAPAAPAADVSAAARALAKRKEELKAAGATPTGGNAAPRQNVKRIYRRADVLKLMEQDVERYEQLAPEIELAYREGRVR